MKEDIPLPFGLPAAIRERLLSSFGIEFRANRECRVSTEADIAPNW
jgi:hypothetical protein